MFRVALERNAMRCVRTCGGYQTERSKRHWCCFTRFASRKLSMCARQFFNRPSASSMLLSQSITLCDRFVHLIVHFAHTNPHVLLHFPSGGTMFRAKLLTVCFFLGVFLHIVNLFIHSVHEPAFHGRHFVCFFLSQKHSP